MPRCSTLMAGSAAVARSSRSRDFSQQAEAVSRAAVCPAVGEVSRVCEFIHDAYPLPRRYPAPAPTAPERQAAGRGEPPSQGPA